MDLVFVLVVVVAATAAVFYVSEVPALQSSSGERTPNGQGPIWRPTPAVRQGSIGRMSMRLSLLPRALPRAPEGTPPLVPSKSSFFFYRSVYG